MRFEQIPVIFQVVIAERRTQRFVELAALGADTIEHVAERAPRCHIAIFDHSHEDEAIHNPLHRRRQFRGTMQRVGFGERSFVMAIDFGREVTAVRVEVREEHAIHRLAAFEVE